MIKLNYAAIATGAAIDNASGNVTLFNMIEEVRVPRDKLPIAIPELAFVGSFTRLEPTVRSMGFQLEYIMPNGKAIAINKSDTAFQGDRMRVVLRLNGMPIVGFGRHKIRVTWHWRNNLAAVSARTEEEDDKEAVFDVFLDVHPFEQAPPNVQ